VAKKGFVADVPAPTLYPAHPEERRITSRGVQLSSSRLVANRKPGIRVQNETAKR